MVYNFGDISTQLKIKLTISVMIKNSVPNEVPKLGTKKHTR